MSRQSFEKLAGEYPHRAAPPFNKIPNASADAQVNKSFLLETLCIPMLMVIHRLLYNLSGFLLDQQERDYGNLLMSSFDPVIPYLSIFVLPYLGTWFLGLAVLGYVLIFKTGSLRVFRSIYAAVLFTTMVELTIWLCFPASISMRVDMQTLYAGGVLDSWLAAIYASATPWNVFPSAHVGFAFMAWLYAAHLARPQHRIWFKLICVLICLSVVFVRNHYLIDIPAGLAVTYLGYRWVFLPTLNKGLFDNLSSSAVLSLVAILCFATIGFTLSIMGTAWSL